MNEQNIVKNNAGSYDPRMEDLPVFISYPRSGSNWLNSIMELYFDKPRLRNGPLSFLPNKKNRNDFMWFHDHDTFSDLELSHKNFLYLHRNPCDVIYSILSAEHDQINSTLVDTHIDRLHKHYEKYLINNRAKTIIKYENLKMNLCNEFERILSFFDIKDCLDAQLLNICNQKVTKQGFIDKATDSRYFNNHMISGSYESNRRIFNSKFKNKICDALMTDEVNKLF